MPNTGESGMHRPGLANLILNLRATKRPVANGVFSLEVWSLALLLWVIIALVWNAL
jgi:hypothetical protein